MLRHAHHVISLILIVSFSAVFCLGDIIQADSTLKIIANPNQTKIEAGSEAIALTAKITGMNLQYAWSLVGFGEISGSDLPAVFYTPPERISGRSAQAIVTVRVTDNAGQQTTESMTFDITQGANVESHAAQPTSTNSGMGRNTKIAIGVGAAAALGGGIALLAGGEEDDDDPFTGIFRGSDWSRTSSNGNLYTGYYVFTLNQDGTILTGTIAKYSTLASCCTNVITVPISGNVDGNSGNLSWGGGEADCKCSWATWITSLSPNSGHVTLLDGNTLVFDEGAEYDRTKMMSPIPKGEYEQCPSPFDSSLTRQ